MTEFNTFKYETKRKNLFLRVAHGHFATTNCHSNYYIDVVAHKARVSEAKAIAEDLASCFTSSTVVDTILCLDGTEVIGAFLAEQLADANVINMNAHKSIYVVTPETTNTNQLLFRDNIVPAIAEKHVLVLAVSVASGKTVEAAIDAVNYYNGSVSGVAAIFSTAERCGGFPVYSVFNPNDLPDYTCCPSNECPMCKAGQRVDALVNCHGYSKL